PTAGLKGEIYALSFIEESTKYLRRYYFTYKSQAIANLRDLLESKLKAEGTRLLAYCSDGAPELISRVYKCWHHKVANFYLLHHIRQRRMRLSRGIIAQHSSRLMRC
ncbi:MAG: hypothetical protein ACK55Z_23495, partial [bacterium]